MYIFFCLALTYALSAADQQGAAEAEKEPSASPMMQVEGFFLALTSSNTDGRVVVNLQGGVIQAKVQMKCFKRPSIKNAMFALIRRIFVWEQH